MKYLVNQLSIFRLTEILLHLQRESSRLGHSQYAKVTNVATCATVFSNLLFLCMNFNIIGHIQLVKEAFNAVQTTPGFSNL